MSQNMDLVLQVLHVDDNIYDLQHVKNALEQDFEECKFQVTSVKTQDEFLATLQSLKPEIVLLDIHLVDETSLDGITLVQQTRNFRPDIVIVMRSNADDASTIAKALRTGADDFISKKTDHGELCHRVLNSYNLARLKSGAGVAPLLMPGKQGKLKFAGATANNLNSQIPNIINSAIRAVHVTGETGVGKEVVADLFQSSVGAGTPFIRVNCGAITPTLLESELFGHVKGAFTGAQTDKLGLVQRASGGWLFLDEIGTLSKAAQSALLRVIENQEVLRVGDSAPRKIDVRVISATNDNLEEMAKGGSFRQDLWMRLRERVIQLPPLRERRDEIPELVAYFCKTMSGGPYQVAPSVVEVLSAVEWSQGNIRELRNCLRAMTEYDANKVLTPIAIPPYIWAEIDQETKVEIEQAGVSSSGNTNDAKTYTVAWDEKIPMSFETLTDKLLLQVVKGHAQQTLGGRASLRSLASAVGMPRTTLSERLKRLIHNGVSTVEELNGLLKTAAF